MEIKVSELRKLIEESEEFSMSDFTSEQIKELANSKQKKKKIDKSYEKFKENYFAYSDDVKVSSRPKQDW